MIQDETKPWMARLIIIACLLGLLILYGYMAIERVSLSVYGNAKTHGVNCTFVDYKLNTHIYHIRNRNKGSGIDGCPVFKQFN